MHGFIAKHLTTLPAEGGGLDHGGLTGLGDDDHTHYHNDARGDARYVELGGDTMTGSLTMGSFLSMAGFNIENVGNINAPAATGLTITANDLLTIAAADAADGRLLIRVANAGVNNIRQEFVNDDIIFSKADGATASFLWDESDNRWEFKTRLNVFQGGTGGIELEGDNTTSSIDWFNNGSAVSGRIGHLNIASTAFHVSSIDNDLFLRATQTTAAAAAVHLQTDDTAGTLRTRLVLDGVGDIEFYKVDGTTQSFLWDETQDRWEMTTDLHLGANDLKSVRFVQSFDVDLVLQAINQGAASQDIQFQADDSGGTSRLRYRILGAGDIQFLKVDGSTVSLLWDETDDQWEMNAPLIIDQPSTTAALPVLTLDQADIDEDFFKIIGTSDTNVDRALVDAVNFTTPGAIVGWMKINVQDDQATAPIVDGDYYVPFYAAPTA